MLVTNETEFIFSPRTGSAAVSMSVVQPRFEPDVTKMNYLLITPQNQEIIVPLTDATALWQHQQFNNDLKVVVVVTGWNSNVNETNAALDTLYKAYQCRDDYNFVVSGKYASAFGQLEKFVFFAGY